MIQRKGQLHLPPPLLIPILQVKTLLRYDHDARTVIPLFAVTQHIHVVWLEIFGLIGTITLTTVIKYTSQHSEYTVFVVAFGNAKVSVATKAPVGFALEALSGLLRC